MKTKLFDDQSIDRVSRVRRNRRASLAVCAALLAAAWGGLAPRAAAQNLVANPGFETGNFSGWTLGGKSGPTYMFVTGTLDGIAPHSGTYQAALGPNGPQGTLSQSLVTVPGQKYTLTFYLANIGGGGTENFSASFDGNTVYAISNPSAFGYTQETFSVRATTSLTPLTFTMEQDPNGFLLDDVSVSNYYTSGPVIQNSAPVLTPTTANFLVAGPVTTGTPTENNTINSLTFLPGGSLNIFNTLFVTQGPVNLVGGSSIFLDGNLSTSQLNVLFGGLLHGAGAIFGNLVNSGNVTPGDAPGTITVTGNYTQTSAGTLSILLQDASQSGHGLLEVVGHGSLNGTLQLVSLDHYAIQPGSKITIVKAAGGIDGTFADVVDPFPKGTIIDPKVIYRDNSVQLETQSFSHYASRHGLSSNQKSIAAGLDSVVAAGQLPGFLRYVEYRPLTELPADFDRIAPEELTSIFTTSIAYAKVQALNLQRRTDDLRSGSNGFSTAGLAINGDIPGYSGSFGITTGVAGPTGSDGKDAKAVQSTVPAESRWGAFLSGTGEWVNVSGDSNARGYNLESGGFTLGLDYRLSPNAAIGIALGYTGTTAHLNARGRVWTNGGKIGLYGTFFQNAPQTAQPMPNDLSKDSSKEAPVVAASARGFYIDVAAFGGYNSFNTRRAGLVGDARGDTDGGEVDALFGTGYDFKAGHLTFGPTASFNYTCAGSNGFTEHGSLAPLNIHGGEGESLRTAFGFKASYDWKIGGLYIKPELRAAWQHEFGDAAYALSANFAEGGGSSFLVNGPRIARDTALLGAGFAVQCSERCAVYLYYDAELGTDYHSTSVTGGLRLSF